MYIQFNIRAILSFFVLAFLLHEAHELSHHLAARIVCGCWSTRDFLYFQLCGECHSYGLIIYSIAGPLMTYLFLWTGFTLLKPSNPDEKKIWGFALVTAALPLPRFLAVAGHGGDEINTMRMIFDPEQPFKGIPVIIGGLLVLLMVLPPVWRAFRSIHNKQKILIFLAFLVIPWQLDELVITRLLNGKLVSSGFLMQPVYFGTPALVFAWEIILLILFFLTRKYIVCFLRDKCR